MPYASWPENTNYNFLTRVNSHSLLREIIQTNNKHKKHKSNTTIFFFPLSLCSTKLSNEVLFITLSRQSYFPQGYYCSFQSFWFLLDCTPHLVSQNSNDFFFFKKVYLCSGPNVSRWAVCAGVWWSGTNTTFNWRARRSRSCHGFSIGRRLIRNSFPLNFIPNFTCDLSQFIQKLYLKEKKKKTTFLRWSFPEWCEGKSSKPSIET